MKKRSNNMRTVALISILLLITGIVFAEDYDSPLFMPVTPEVTAQGGSFTAVAHGYNSLFTNPAGFAREDGSFTILSASPASYFVPDEATINAFSNLTNDAAAVIESVSDIIMDNGIGARLPVGAIGIAGKRIGLGLVGDVDVYGRGGTTALGTTLDATVTMGLIGGYAHPFHFGATTVNLGGDVKYLKRTEVRDLGLLDVMESTNSDSGAISADVYTGSGLGFDIGTIVERGPWSLGLALRDVGGTAFEYVYLDSINPDDPSSLIPGSTSGTEVTGYAIPMSMNVGFGWDPEPPRGLRFFFDPMVHAEWQHVMYKEDPDRVPSFWAELHAGTEVRVFRFIKVRAGINQGYPTVGAGIKLLFLDVNMAYFGREIGRYAGTKPNEGLAIEAAIRF